MKIALHVTHEAIQKMGGIGTVIQGLITSSNYKKIFKKTMLYTPMFRREGPADSRLGRNIDLIYSSLDHVDVKKMKSIFRPIETKYNVHIAYGKKKYFSGPKSDVHSAIVDILAVDIWNMNEKEVNAFKYRIWEKFGIQSDHFQHDSDYEQYLRIGIVIIEIFEALYGKKNQAVVFSHEYMGMASALAFEMAKSDKIRNNDITIFYAHEVSTARVVTENHPGHDFSFYNILKHDIDMNISLEDEFGSFAHYSRNELVKRATDLNYIFAVSDITKEEFVYLIPNIDQNKIKVVYNGIPIEKTTYKAKVKSIDKISRYCEALFNFTPDYIFSHVTRLVISKALWRDISFLYHLDEYFSKKGAKGFFIVLTTLIGDGRPNEQIYRMEAEYGWPVVHKDGWPDLVGSESELYHYLELFNSRSKAIKGVFINQFGFNRERCGFRIPENTSIFDLRAASDVEFGLSIYEPFGIAQLETIPYGGIPLISSSCGCSKLLVENFKSEDYLSVDFTEVPPSFDEIFKTKSDFKHVTTELRDQIESEICHVAAQNLFNKLPHDEKSRKKRFERMSKTASILDWDHVATRIGDILNGGH